MIMERVTRGRVTKVQVLLQRRACCASACVPVRACAVCLTRVCCSKRWLVLRCVAAHGSGCIKRAAAFIIVCRLLLPPALQTAAAARVAGCCCRPRCRLLLPPALQADSVFRRRHGWETALRCFAI